MFAEFSSTSGDEKHASLARAGSTGPSPVSDSPNYSSEHLWTFPLKEM